jgi:ABC-type Fe3+/spermidine/putrescine transport system ATPase subunit
MAQPRFLDVERVSVGYGRTLVLRDISLAVGEGQLVALLGSSGCGKTTLLRTIAGFAQPSAGTIRVAGEDITRLAPDRRDMALVFQSYALWPHMNVRQNITYGLKLRRVGGEAIARKLEQILGMLALDGLADRNVTALSGGQRQRVALGRALAIDPRILLLDEPLSNLDARIRQSVRHEIRALQRRLGITAIHVTHDREEAMVMADRIVILNAGRIEQEGPPEEVYNAPATPFVAKFMGAENTIELPASVRADRIDIAAGPHNEAASLSRRTGGIVASNGGTRGALTAYFRGETAELVGESSPEFSADRGDRLVLTGEVAQVSYPGGAWRHTVHVGGRAIQVDSPVRHAPEERVRLRLPAEAVFFFPGDEAPVEDGLREAAE